MYNRASADPNGQPWDPDPPGHPVERRQVGRRRARLPAHDEPADPDAWLPFIMNGEGVGRLFLQLADVDGPFPEHYEPMESPIDNPLHPSRCRPSPVAFLYDKAAGRKNRFGTVDATSPTSPPATGSPSTSTTSPSTCRCWWASSRSPSSSCRRSSPRRRGSRTATGCGSRRSAGSRGARAGHQAAAAADRRREDRVPGRDPDPLGLRRRLPAPIPTGEVQPTRWPTCSRPSSATPTRARRSSRPSSSTSRRHRGRRRVHRTRARHPPQVGDAGVVDRHPPRHHRDLQARRYRPLHRLQGLRGGLQGMERPAGRPYGQLRQLPEPPRPDGLDLGPDAVQGDRARRRRSRLAHPQGQLSPLRRPRLPGRLPGAGGHRPVHQRHRQLRPDEVHRVPVLRHRLPVRHPPLRPEDQEGLQVHAVRRPGLGVARAGLREELPDRGHQVRRQARDGGHRQRQGRQAEEAGLRPRHALRPGGRGRAAHDVRGAPGRPPLGLRAARRPPRAGDVLLGPVGPPQARLDLGVGRPAGHRDLLPADGPAEATAGGRGRRRGRAARPGGGRRGGAGRPGGTGRHRRRHGRGGERRERCRGRGRGRAGPVSLPHPPPPQSEPLEEER